VTVPDEVCTHLSRWFLAKVYLFELSKDINPIFIFRQLADGYEIGGDTPA
jgi:hypothetical protein